MRSSLAEFWSRLGNTSKGLIAAARPSSVETVVAVFPAGPAQISAERIGRRLAAILAADVAGYSGLTGADEKGTVARIRALRADLINPAISANRGRVFRTAGDSILIEFASVVDAVRAAIDVQRAMTVRNADFVPEKRIVFRVDIHLGDVIVESDGNLMGDGVNIAARLEGIALISERLPDGGRVYGKGLA
jgi:class 3 adenylate cyclase